MAEPNRDMIHWTNTKANRLINEADHEAWKDTPGIVHNCMDYPIEAGMRWDAIPTGNNEDLFRGILYDYSALKEGFQDGIGQQIYFGVSGSLENTEDDKHVTTAAFRAVYRKDNYHEAQLVVGHPKAKNPRDVKVVVNASKKQVDINAPLKLYNIFEKDVTEVTVGAMAYYQKDDITPAILLFFDGTRWKEVGLRDINNYET
jgi:hypothetical protein